MKNQLIIGSVLAMSISTVPQFSYAIGGKGPVRMVVQSQQVNNTVTGNVTDASGEPLIGVSVLIKGTSKGAITDIDGNYKLAVGSNDATLVFSYIGYATQEIGIAGRSSINVKMQEEGHSISEVVVTAMGIQRKESSLTYATQRVKAEDLMKVQDPNVANSLEGKVSGITITPNAGGAGGASKIVLRGSKSILGNSSPLIVVDGVPMTNNTRGQRDFSGEGFRYSGMSEGSDPLSMINPDDIESMNVLKGANAAALYGSVAANGVIMITTKKGREGKLDVNFTSNVTFDTPLKTPKIQNIYGAEITSSGLSTLSWGGKLSDMTADQLIQKASISGNIVNTTGKIGETQTERDIYLRNSAGNDLNDFYRTGVTTNNSVSLSGGTETLRTYFSAANSHANGMIEQNSYNRNTFNFRQTYKFFKRLNVDASLNYAETITRNRPGGGTVGNPIYHLYIMPRNVDLGYYRNNYMTQAGVWNSYNAALYVQQAGENNYIWQGGQHATLRGPMQNWAFLSNDHNNPYWLINQNQNKQKESRVFGTVSANIDIYDGLSFQARVKYDKIRYNSESRRYATTFLPSAIDAYGHYWNSESTSTDLYTDFLLSYNKQFGDYSASATAGYVGHTLRTETKSTDINATYYDKDASRYLALPTAVNYFETNGGDRGATSTSKSSNWDKAYLFTAQLGWKEMVYLDGSYRRDWYRPYRLFKDMGVIDRDNFGYFGVGANAIVSSLTKLPEWFNYLKVRLSYSEVGNSIPNFAYQAASRNLATGALNASNYNSFKPKDEKTSSFEAGLEMLFLKDCLSFDFTYYNATMSNLFMTVGAGNGKTTVLNSARVRNQGFESTIGYDYKISKDLRWKTAFNFSFNDNKILATASDANGNERLIQQNVAGAMVRYKIGGSIGDLYVHDYKRNADGKINISRKEGLVRFDISGDNDIYVGNMNSKWQLGWSNTFNYKDFQVFFLINGRIGGKVISLTEAYLDNLGLSERTAEARLAAEASNLVDTERGNVPAMYMPDGSGRVIPIKTYYESISNFVSPMEYIYNGTNFRLRELSLGYTFRNLLGQNKNLNVSFIARNLFFLYNESPVDPDVSLSTTNGLGGFELFNMPSSRSFGLSLKLNF